ncbi:MAG TPA: NUDIX hydrolase [Candidatus Dormibacteraeota bacterium]|nr:NUDIX hydrolase [Candidatus Dormibacteraeota bacterium]
MNSFFRLIGNILFWLAWPALFIYLKNSKRCRVIISDGKNILIVKNWLGPNKFTLPGGGLKKNENPKAGTAREIKEETGIIVDSNNLSLIEPEKLVDEYGHSYESIGYLLKINQSPKIVRQKFEIADIKWVDIQEALEKYSLTAAAKNLITTWLDDNHLVD